MKFFVKGLILMTTIIALLYSPAYAEMTSAKKISEIQTKIEGLLKEYKPEDILVIFDIDMTLTQPDHPAVYYPNMKKHTEIFKKVMDSLTPEQRDYMLIYLVHKLPQKVVEEETVKTVQSIQKKGVKVIAFTASPSGKFTDSKNKYIFKRRNALQKMGFDFSKSLKDLTTVVTFTEFHKHLEGYPMFYHGVLSSNGEQNKGVSKGTVLTAFLKILGPHPKRHGFGYTPKVIVFADDRQKNLDTVEAELTQHYPDIRFIGIEYQGAFEYAPKDISVIDFEKFWRERAHEAKVHAK